MPDLKPYIGEDANLKLSASRKSCSCSGHCQSFHVDFDFKRSNPTCRVSEGVGSKSIVIVSSGNKDSSMATLGILLSTRNRTSEYECMKKAKSSYIFPSQPLVVAISVQNFHSYDISHLKEGIIGPKILDRRRWWQSWAYYLLTRTERPAQYLINLKVCNASNIERKVKD